MTRIHHTVTGNTVYNTNVFSKWQPCNIFSRLNFKVTLNTVLIVILIFISVWKLHPTMLELDFWADKYIVNKTIFLLAVNELEAFQTPWWQFNKQGINFTLIFISTLTTCWLSFCRLLWSGINPWSGFSIQSICS
jgi:hypothetical protein